MPIFSVSLNGGTPSLRTVQLRTTKLVPGVLCEVSTDEGMQLCVVERVNGDDSVSVRSLPGPSHDTSARPNHA